MSGEGKGAALLDPLAKQSDEHEFYHGVPEGYERGKTKYVIITGSVMSGVGKGTLSSCLANLLALRYGLHVEPVKFDGYLNYDAGTLNPYRHGEVFVLDDGTECDLDLGSYERFLDKGLTKGNYLTAGKIFKRIIDKERAGGFLGRDVQFIPHVTGEIKRFLRELAVRTKAEVIQVEVGGTVGDLENSYFLEAMRELAFEEGRKNVCFVNVTYVMRPRSLGEHKSKAAQLGLRTLMSLGIQPDIVLARSEQPVPDKVREKLSIYSNVPVERVFNAYDTDNVYAMPEFLHEQGLDRAVLELVQLPAHEKRNGGFHEWEALVGKMRGAGKPVVVGMVGKYTSVHDSYLSILKALESAVPRVGRKLELRWIDATNVRSQAEAGEALKGVDGIVVPGGFGERGVEGKIECIRFAREHGLPFLGLCYGMQLATIEYARNVCGLAGAHTTEVDAHAKHPVICILPEQEEVTGLGGTMRLGGFDVVVAKGTKAHELYGSERVRERFRHRYNVNPKYIDQLEAKGLVFSGRAPEKRIMQMMELPKHRFFMGSQFHPEFTARPLQPNPLFLGFVKACATR